MPGAKTFIDTNIWVYAHLHGANDVRHELALVRAEREPDAVISP